MYIEKLCWINTQASSTNVGGLIKLNFCLFVTDPEKQKLNSNLGSCVSESWELGTLKLAKSIWTSKQQFNIWVMEEVKRKLYPSMIVDGKAKSDDEMMWNYKKWYKKGEMETDPV